MKAPKTSIILLALSASISLVAQTTQIIFSASIDNSPVAIDSIWVKNVTRGVDTILYTPDTSLILDLTTQIMEKEFSPNDLYIQIVGSNPYDSETKIKVNIGSFGVLSIKLYDALGNLLTESSSHLNQGKHEYVLSGGPSGILYIEAQWNDQRFVKRLVNIGSYRPVDFQYKGMTEGLGTHMKDGWFTWQLGDSLFYIIYATGPYGYVFSAASYEQIYGSETLMIELLPGVVCQESPILEDIDGNLYSVVQIGSQCWMAENLKTTRYRDGSAIPHVPDSSNWFSYSLITGAWCYYGNDPGYNEIYGKLYNGYVAANPNTCPLGWHVPTEAEWTQLFNQLGGEGIAGGKLKSSGTLEDGTGLWSSPNTGGTNESGFSAQPGGFRLSFNGSGTWYDLFSGLDGSRGLWWMQSEGTPWVQIRSHGLHNEFESVATYEDVPSHGLSIRCIRDMDCSGVPDGLAFIDDCGACAGGETGVVPNSTCELDCNGVWGGTAIIDECGICAGGNTGQVACEQDCLGEWGGAALPGSICDDGNEATINDLFNENCECFGFDDVGCPDFVQDVDGNTYSVVQIGAQCWMSENLRTLRFRDGSNILSVTTPSSAWNNAHSQQNPATSSVNNNNANDTVYGRLYNWYVVLDSREVCPQGWRVPSDLDWQNLESALGMPDAELALVGFRGLVQNVGGVMKEVSGLWDDPNMGAINTSGFSGVPAGYRSFGGSFQDEGARGMWWSNTGNSNLTAFSRYLYDYSGAIYRDASNKGNGFSLRCIRE